MGLGLHGQMRGEIIDIVADVHAYVYGHIAHDRARKFYAYGNLELKFESIARLSCFKSHCLLYCA